jgi:hypothetical protein
MDKRVNSNATHGLEVFKGSNGGGSFPAPRETGQSVLEDSIHILLERVDESEDDVGVIGGFSGHSDCVAVRSILKIGTHGPVANPKSKARKKQRQITRQLARTKPYQHLVKQILEQKKLQDPEEQLRILTMAKVLQDINYALAHDDIMEEVNDGKLRLVAYFEDVVSNPRQLYIFNPTNNAFELTRHRLKELSQSPALLEQYALDKPVDVVIYIRDAIACTLQPQLKDAAHEMLRGDAGAGRGARKVIPSARQG